MVNNNKNDKNMCVNMILKYMLKKGTRHNYDMILSWIVSDCQMKEPGLEAKDDHAAVRLWDVSSQLVGYKEEKWYQPGSKETMIFHHHHMPAVCFCFVQFVLS